MNNKTHSKKWDLEDRTAKFRDNIIKFCRKSPKNPITIPLISQIIKTSTSVGVQIYRDEADDAEIKKKDFSNWFLFKSIRFRGWNKIICRSNLWRH